MFAASTSHASQPLLPLWTYTLQGTFCGTLASSCFLLFTHSEIRKGGGNNKGTTSLVVAQLASDTKINHATRVTTLWLNYFYSGMHLTKVTSLCGLCR